nr:MAG TPA: hypothetical protein [Caudoviricetes sp.]
MRPCGISRSGPLCFSGLREGRAFPHLQRPCDRPHGRPGLTSTPRSRSIAYVHSVNQQKGNGHDRQRHPHPAGRPAGRHPPHRRGRQQPHPVDPHHRRPAGLPGRRPAGPPLRRLPQRRPPRRPLRLADRHGPPRHGRPQRPLTDLADHRKDPRHERRHHRPDRRLERHRRRRAPRRHQGHRQGRVGRHPRPNLPARPHPLRPFRHAQQPLRQPQRGRPGDHQGRQLKGPEAASHDPGKEKQSDVPPPANQADPHRERLRRVTHHPGRGHLEG